MPNSNRTFLRWVRKNHPKWEEEYHRALTSFRDVLEPMTFVWVDRDFTNAKLKANELWFERVCSANHIDNVCIQLDPDSRLSFAVRGTRRKHSIEHPEFIRNCSLVRKRSDAYYGSKLYGARWWYPPPLKILVFRRAVRKVVEQLPQVDDYLNSGTVGRNIWVVDF